MSMFEEDRRRERLSSLEQTLDHIRGRYGYFAIQRAMMLGDPALSGVDIKGERVEERVGYQG